MISPEGCVIESISNQDQFNGFQTYQNHLEIVLKVSRIIIIVSELFQTCLGISRSYQNRPSIENIAIESGGKNPVPHKAGQDGTKWTRGTTGHGLRPNKMTLAKVRWSQSEIFTEGEIFLSIEGTSRSCCRSVYEENSGFLCLTLPPGNKENFEGSTFHFG